MKKIVDLPAMEKWREDFIKRNSVISDADSIIVAAIEAVFCILRNMPDAEEKRGKWEFAIGYDINKKVQCQNCFKMAYEPTSYCPNCGAKMDLGETQE